MSVLFKGMKMPKSCWECRCRDCEDFCVLLNVDCTETYGKRLDNCPLIELPDHGDLIDRDALCVRGGRNCGKTFLAELLKNAPVVILAERSKDE